MKFYILASVIILCLVISHNVTKAKRIQAKKEQSFWEKERQANEVRRKPLDGLNYIKIPLSALPMNLMAEHEQVADCLETINNLSMEPIVNFTGFTNTDLKLEYGTANISILTEYDQNYTLLANTLQKWADLLYQAGHVEETKAILEFAVSTHTDVSRSYDLLAEIYLSQGMPEKLGELKAVAETLRSLNKEVILRHLKGLEQD